MASSRLAETLPGDSLATEDDDRAAGVDVDAGVLYGVAEGAAAASVRGDGLATGLAGDEAVAFAPVCGDAFGCGVEAEDAAPVEPDRLVVDGDGPDGAAAFAPFLAGAPFATTPLRDCVKVLSMPGKDFGRALCDDLLPVRLVATWPDPFSRAE